MLACWLLTARNLHPTDEDLSAGTPDLGQPEVVAQRKFVEPGPPATRKELDSSGAIELRIHCEGQLRGNLSIGDDTGVDQSCKQDTTICLRI